MNDRITLVFPKDKTSLEKKYSKVLAEIVVEMLTDKELQYLISELEKQVTNEDEKSKSNAS